jgi:DNA-binding response OmpR family regulator
MSTRRGAGTDEVSIVIVDDEDDLRGAVAEHLGDEGYRVSGVASAAAFRELAAVTRIDAVILDLAMPGEDGLSLARWIRSNSRMGIIFATAAGRPIDRIVGFETGADDYLVKPYALRELSARLKGLLRRLPADGGAAIGAPPRSAGEVRTFGNCRFDPAAASLTRDGRTESLTAAESRLLVLLTENPGRVFSRPQLAAAIGMTAQNDRAVDSAIVRLRRKIEDDPASPRHLKTVRGEGYSFESRQP